MHLALTVIAFLAASFSFVGSDRHVVAYDPAVLQSAPFVVQSVPRPLLCPDGTIPATLPPYCN